MKRNLLIFMCVVLCLWHRPASAFWGSDSTDAASGLDVAAGFDVNTITSIAGTVTSLPERKGQEQHTVMVVATNQGAVTVVLGPWWHWEKQSFSISKNREIAITGSLAQGKDGAMYLFAQRLENPESGETLTLRSDSGKPLWSRNGSGNRNGGGPHGGMGSRPGAGFRGGTRGGIR
ncbi:MAG: hypothetical protein M0023_01680 [Desulfobacteraceae bacterium]|nr:hypothetical protein [Desulfobacteraceae bacterium]